MPEPLDMKSNGTCVRRVQCCGIVAEVTDAERTAAAATPLYASADVAQPAADPLATSGLVIVDKPAGMTSHDVVSRLRRLMRTRKVGHAGTLDPMATGVLVCGIERGTKLMNHLITDTKSYKATIRLGFASSTDDAEGELRVGPAHDNTDSLLHQRVASLLAELAADPHKIASARDAFVGDIMQRPASVSAIKVAGKRAYDLVREGQEVQLQERPVTVSRFEILGVRTASVEIPIPSSLDTEPTKAPTELRVVDVDVEVDCSSGTYIRALARDLGEALEVGGHLTMLRRTRVGAFGLDRARTLEQLAEEQKSAEAKGANPARANLSLSLDNAILAGTPCWEVSATEAHALSQGQRLERQPSDERAAALGPDGHVVAIVQRDGRVAKPIFVARPATLV